LVVDVLSLHVFALPVTVPEPASPSPSSAEAVRCSFQCSG
jgi:hypothetical protein